MSQCMEYVYEHLLDFSCYMLPGQERDSPHVHLDPHETEELLEKFRPELPPIR
jgi:hypothetical protein